MLVLCTLHNANFFFLVCYYSTYPFCKAAVVGSYVSVIPALKKKKKKVEKKELTKLNLTVNYFSYSFFVSFLTEILYWNNLLPKLRERLIDRSNYTVKRINNIDCEYKFPCSYHEEQNAIY